MKFPIPLGINFCLCTYKVKATFAATTTTPNAKGNTFAFKLTFHFHI